MTIDHRSLIKCAAIATALPFLGLAGDALAAQKLVITLDTPATHVRNVWVGKFAKALTERSNGALVVEIFDSGQLYSSRDESKAVARGDVGMAIISTGALSSVESSLSALDLPVFGGRRQDEMNAIVDGPLGKALAGKVEKKLKVVVPGGWYVLGEINSYSTKKPLKSYEDFKGMQVRTPGGAAYVARFQEWGATPLSMPFTDVPLALQQGTVDAIASSNASIVSAKLQETGLAHAFLNRVSIGYYMPIVSQSYWNSLAPAQQTLFAETWGEFVVGQRAAAAEQQQTARATLEAGGMTFVEPSEVETAANRERMMGLQDRLIPELGIPTDIAELLKAYSK